jgi:hypothetical protein
MSNAKNAKAVGEIFSHPFWGRVTVTAAVKGSFTLCEIKCIQRDEGWFEAGEYYRPVKIVRLNPDAGPGAKTITWKRNQKDNFGETDICHIGELKELDHEEV